MGMKKICQYATHGMGYGAVTYLLLIAIHIAPASVSRENVLSLLLMSTAIGILSTIFDNDHEKFPFSLLLGIHLVGTAVLVVVLMVYNHWSMHFIFILIYVMIWLVVVLDQHFRVVQINQALKKRSKNKF